MKAFWVYGGLLLLLTGMILCFSQPPQVLGAYASDLSPRTEEQRANIRQAASALDGQKIEPGAACSFNRLVGPRTLQRGYRPAPAFLEAEVTASVGGGLCQVSSTLYAAALEGGFPILARVPHRYRVYSVPPGRDATVWYGKADLVWKNDRSTPVRIEAKVKGDRLFIRLLGSRPRPVRISTREVPASQPGTRLYETRRTVGGTENVWWDSYREETSSPPRR